ncbi:hypothetical protein [Mesorhizobium captivum]|uniref:hypothetical protein n=1 Tax=Mesorhizobium captivum TaxID=3072319 RepID=UPI003D6B646A
MRSLDQRANTILKVAAEIVGQQGAFPEYGVGGDVEQVYAHATWCIRTEVFLHRRDRFLPRRHGALR